MARLTVEHALAELQRLVRRRPAADGIPALTARIPDDLQSDEAKVIALPRDEYDALKRVRKLLPEDLRFEYLEERAAEAATWRFVCLAHMRSGDHVPEFVAEHAREPMERTCFLPLELLTVSEELDLLGVRLLPVDQASPPEPFFGPPLTETTRTVVAVPVRGTSYEKMNERARATADHTLRLLRATLRAHRWIAHEQLRFRLGPSFWFDDNRSGWKRAPDEGWELTLDEPLVELASSQPMWSLPEVPRTDVERSAELAVRWYERAQLVVERIDKLLYLFFALEAILGDTSEGLKAPALAIRRAMLGGLTTGHFIHPARTYLLYGEVRSAAVHGEPPPDVDEREIGSFAWDIRIAINEFLQFAADRGLVKRKRVRQALDTDEQRQGLIDTLLEEDPDRWRPYLAPARDALRVTLEVGSAVRLTPVDGGGGERLDDAQDMKSGDIAVVRRRSVRIATDEAKIVVELTRVDGGASD
jgi:hypothetical protein